MEITRLGGGQHLALFERLYGGLNNRLPATEIDDSEAQDLLNIDHYGRDILSRKGYLRLNATQDSGGGVGLGLVEFNRKDGTRKRVVKFGSRFNSFDSVDSAAVLTNLKTGVSAAGPFKAAVGNNLLAIANRGDNWLYDATNFEVVGKAAPGTTPVLTSPAGGACSAGVYSVYYRFRASTTGELSPKTAAATETAVANDKIACVIAAGDLAALTGYWDQVAIFVKAPGSTKFFRSGTSTTSPYDHTSSDSTLSALPEDTYTTNANEPIGVLPAMHSVVYHLGRAFWAGDPAQPSRLYYSESGLPGQVLTNNYLDIVPEEYGVIQALAVHFNQVVIFKNSAIVVLTPEGATTTWFPTVLVRGTGTIGSACVVNVDNRLIFIDERGVFSFDGIAVSDPPESDRIEGSLIGQLEATRAAFFQAHHDGERKHALFSVTLKDATKNTRELVWHYNIPHPNGGPGPWSIFDIEGTSYGLFHDADVNLCTVFTDRQGFVYRRNKNDRDGPIANLTGTATAATATTLSDTTLSPFQTGGSHVLGYKISIISGLGAGQTREITVVNGVSQVTVDSAWATTPNATSVYHVGAISAYWTSRSESFGTPMRRKRVQEIVALTGTAATKLSRSDRRALYHAMKFSNLGAEQPWRVKGYSVRFSVMVGERTPAASSAVTTEIDQV